MIRPGIAFFSTLLLLSLTSVLVTLSIRDSSEIRQRMRQDRLLVQENILLQDSIKFIWNKLLKRIKELDKDTQENLVRSFLGKPIEIPNQLNNSSIFITLQNDEGKVNINKITDDQRMGNFFDNFFDTLGIADRDLLRDLFATNIRTDHDALANFDLSNIILDFSRGPIENFDRFNKIIARYYDITEDASINQVDWLSLIRFEGDGFNINYAPETIVMALPTPSLSIKQKQKIANHQQQYHKVDDLYKEVEIVDKEQEAQIESEKQKLDEMEVNYTTNSLQVTVIMDLISYKVEYHFLINTTSGKTTHISMLK